MFILSLRARAANFLLLRKMEKEAVDQLLQGMKHLQEEMKIVRQGQEETALRLAGKERRHKRTLYVKEARERTPARFYKQTAGGGQDGDSYGVHGEGGCNVIPLERAIEIEEVCRRSESAGG